MAYLSGQKCHFLVCFGFGLVFGEGMLSYDKDHYKEPIWYIEFSGNVSDGIDLRDLIILNPESYPNILIPENIGKNVVYAYPVRGIFLAYLGPYRVVLYLLDFKNDFYIKLLLFFVLSSIFAFSIIFFIYYNRKHFQIINKIF